MAITTILTVYRRPHLLQQQVDLIKKQSVESDIWIWVNPHKDNCSFNFTPFNDYTIIYCNYNFKFLGRFAAAMLAQTEHIALFDDDTMPGPLWYENCLENIGKRIDGASYCHILGGAGVILNSRRYEDHERVGWPSKNKELTEVDLVGHAWFAEKDALRLIWREEPLSYETGEDIFLGYIAKKHGILTCCPPQDTMDKTSSLFPQLGVDNKTESVTNHQDFFPRRDACIEEALRRGWDTVRGIK